MPEFPAGSQITQCRTIPICGRCGSDELYQQLDGACGIGWGLSSAGVWPVDDEDIDEREERYEKRRTPAILDGSNLITEDGSAPIINPCNTGGWAQYGLADE
jgi:hypothetical protein